MPSISSLLSFTVAVCSAASAEGLSSGGEQSSRRQWLASSSASGILAVPLILAPQRTNAADELPAFLRRYTALAPLGAKEESPKTRNLSLNDIATRLTNDLIKGSTNQGGYFLTGDLSTDLFRDDCVFVDPTNNVSSLSRYQKALRILFDPNRSRVELVKRLVVNQQERTISGRIRSRGVLQLPWHPRVSAYESNIVYSMDDDGLISRQAQTWTKSASEALRESFTPNLFSDAPSCIQSTAPAGEPPEVTRLVDRVNGRRPNDYTQEERLEIAGLMDAIVERQYEWKRDLLPGKWVLAYLQPGPDGGGIDRRIPFPEFDFNDNFQVFTRDAVTNIGQVFGPLVFVEVSGPLSERDPSSLKVPKRFVANINSGKLCWNGVSPCVPLPISGEGIFDGVYLGERLRIGQNLNGGGARVVQVRVG